VAYSLKQRAIGKVYDHLFVWEVETFGKLPNKNNISQSSRSMAAMKKLLKSGITFNEHAPLHWGSLLGITASYVVPMPSEGNKTHITIVFMLLMATRYR